MESKRTVILSLGSNLGNREKMLEEARTDLSRLKDTELISESLLYETEPWGEEHQPMYLNQCILMKTKKTPLQLLSSIHRIEYKHGRKRDYRYCPRTLDIDIIGYEGIVSSEHRLQLPHPRAAERLFVLCPLMDLFPNPAELEKKYGLKLSYPQNSGGVVIYKKTEKS